MEGAPEVATEHERIDFLKQMVAFTQDNIRTYDTKAYISLAAFGLSVSPLFAVTNTACSAAAIQRVVMVMLLAYVSTIVTYLWVLWPVSAPPSALTDKLNSQNIFFCP